MADNSKSINSVALGYFTVGKLADHNFIKFQFCIPGLDPVEVF